jgi:hypothetical protein
MNKIGEFFCLFADYEAEKTRIRPPGGHLSIHGQGEKIGVDRAEATTECSQIGPDERHEYPTQFGPGRSYRPERGKKVRRSFETRERRFE